MNMQQLVLHLLGCIWLAIGGLGVVLLGWAWWGARRSRDALALLFLKVGTVVIGAPSFLAMAAGLLVVFDVSGGRVLLFLIGAVVTAVGMVMPLSTSHLLRSACIGFGLVSTAGTLWTVCSG